MKRIFKFLTCAVLGAACIGLAACDEEKSVPTSDLELKATPQSVKAGEEVTFTVTKNGADVTSAAEILNLTEQGVKVAAKWSTDKPGTYQFAAVHDGRTSPTIEVTVTSGIQTGEYKRRVLAMDFTGTACSACPTMTRMLDSYVKSNPDRLVVIAAHVNVPSEDPLTIPEGERLAVVAGCAGSAPNVWVDYREVSSTNLTTFRAKVERSINEYPATAGIALESSVAGDKVTVKSAIRIKDAGTFKICAALLEDDINVPNSVERVYQHVLRTFATSPTGDDLGACVAGQEVTKNFDFTLDASWNAANCRVAVYVLRETEDGHFYVNNIRECAIDGKADFDYEE